MVPLSHARPSTSFRAASLVLAARCAQNDRDVELERAGNGLMAQHMANVGGLAVLAALLSWALTGLYTRAMITAGRLEPPNARSMHEVPVPVGAGIAIVGVVLSLWPLWPGSMLQGQHALLGSALAGLALLSWADDRLGLSPAVRLAAQGLAVAMVLVSLPSGLRVLPLLPLAAERILLGLAWLWFVNLFNFMDGIDGLAGSEAIAVALGYLLVATLADLHGPLRQLALIVAAATLGYLFWNWHPARVFMGDAGSVPLGFLLGWLMIDLAVNGHWAAAVILPLYFAADATFTLARRLLHGERPWQAHRAHFYQRAVLGGATPSAVVWRVGMADAVLIVMAPFSLWHPALALASAAAVVAALLVDLEALARKRSS